MIDYSALKFAKIRPRVLERQDAKKQLAAEERECRAAVKQRDKGRCRVPGCTKPSAHLHHVVYRSRGGKWQPENIVSICAPHHQMIHVGLITVGRVMKPVNSEDLFWWQLK